MRRWDRCSRAYAVLFERELLDSFTCDKAFRETLRPLAPPRAVGAPHSLLSNMCFLHFFGEGRAYIEKDELVNLAVAKHEVPAQLQEAHGHEQQCAARESGAL